MDVADFDGGQACMWWLITASMARLMSRVRPAMRTTDSGAGATETYDPGCDSVGHVFAANLWWYAFNVLRPAKPLKPLGLYRSREIGHPPLPAPPAEQDSTSAWSTPTPVLLTDRPES